MSFVTTEDKVKEEAIASLAATTEIESIDSAIAEIYHN